MQLEGNRRQEDRVQRQRSSRLWVPDLVDERYDAASQSRAVFVQDDWLASAQTTLSLGAGRSTYTRSEGNVFDGVRRRYQSSSPMLNLLWRPDKTAQWKLGLSRAFRLPEPRDLMPRRWTRPENSSRCPTSWATPNCSPKPRGRSPAAGSSAWGGEALPSLGLNLVLKRVDDVNPGRAGAAGRAVRAATGNFGRAWVGSPQGRWGRARPRRPGAARSS